MLNFRKIFTQSQKWKLSFTHQQTDLSSVAECIDKHVDSLFSKKELKSWTTTDQKTLDICEEILKDKPIVRETIMGRWETKDSINETKSVKITISPIERYA